MDPKVYLSTTLDIGTDEPLELFVEGSCEKDAMCSMANFLHLQMFASDVQHNVYRDICDYQNELEFLESCRSYVCIDPNALTSDMIWSSLKNAVDSIKIEMEP